MKYRIQGDQNELLNAAASIPRGKHEVESHSQYVVYIEKPGFKGPADFKVWLEDGNGQRMLSWTDVGRDLVAKAKEGTTAQNTNLLAVFELCCECTDPLAPEIQERVTSIRFKTGYPVTVLLLVLKWLWIQEDSNYPKGEGRYRSLSQVVRRALLEGDFDVS